MNKVPAEHIAAMVNTLSFKFSHVEETTTVICLAILPNGFRVGNGDSACIDPEEFNFNTGKEIAKERAIKHATDNLWLLEGYLLKTTGNLSVIPKHTKPQLYKKCATCPFVIEGTCGINELVNAPAEDEAVNAEKPDSRVMLLIELPAHE